MTCDGCPGAGGGISLISRDGQLVNGFGVRDGASSALVGSEEPWSGLLEGKGDGRGDVDSFGVVSQSIRLKVVNNVRENVRNRYQTYHITIICWILVRQGRLAVIVALGHESPQWSHRVATRGDD